MAELSVTTNTLTNDPDQKQITSAKNFFFIHFQRRKPSSFFTCLHSFIFFTRKTFIQPATQMTKKKDLKNIKRLSQQNHFSPVLESWTTEGNNSDQTGSPKKGSVLSYYCDLTIQQRVFKDSFGKKRQSSVSSALLLFLSLIEPKREVSTFQVQL